MRRFLKKYREAGQVAKKKDRDEKSAPFQRKIELKLFQKCSSDCKRSTTIIPNEYFSKNWEKVCKETASDKVNENKRLNSLKARKIAEICIIKPVMIVNITLNRF